jgi:transposase-like protein
MARPPVVPAEEKVRIVLSVLAGEVTVAEAARRAKVSEQSDTRRRRCGSVGVQDGEVAESFDREGPVGIRKALTRCPSIDVSLDAYLRGHGWSALVRP